MNEISFLAFPLDASLYPLRISLLVYTYNKR